MSRAVRTFYGLDTYTRHIEVAQSDNGQWYHREYGFNGYGKCWSRWEILQSAPKFRTMTASAGKYQQLEWGFNWLDETTPEDGKISYRLPN